MKKIKRGTPEKLVCDFCGAEKKEITFMIGACSKPGTDWCMIYGTGKMACPACYPKATEEARQKEKAWDEKNMAPAPKAEPAPARELVAAVQAPAAPVEPAACVECSRKRGQRGPCSDYGGFGCGLYFEQHPETHFKPEPAAPAKIIEAEAETVETPAEKVESAQKAFFNNEPGSGAALDNAILEEERVEQAQGVNMEPCKSFESADAVKALRPILDQVKNAVYLPGYRAGKSDAEALGVLASKFFKWDGAEILAVAFSGLEDANNHQEAAIIERMQKGEDLGRIITNLEDQNKTKARIIAAQSELMEKMAKELSAMHSEYCKDCAGGCPTLELIDKAKNAEAPDVPAADYILAALIQQRDYCDKQANAGSEDAALWRQAAGKARAAIDRFNK